MLPLLSSDLHDKFDQWAISHPELKERPKDMASDEFANTKATWRKQMGVFTDQYLSPYFKYKRPPVDKDGKIIAESSSRLTTSAVVNDMAADNV